MYTKWSKMKIKSNKHIHNRTIPHRRHLFHLDPALRLCLRLPTNVHSLTDLTMLSEHASRKSFSQTLKQNRIQLSWCLAIHSIAMYLQLFTYHCDMEKVKPPVLGAFCRWVQSQTQDAQALENSACQQTRSALQKWTVYAALSGRFLQPCHPTVPSLFWTFWW